MKGSEISLMKFMEGSSKRFVIPVYQRNYDWKITNCKQLFDDLEKVIKHQRKNHFFGSIVSVYNQDGKDEEHLVIDGQQRLTTISLLLLAMYNILKNNVLEANDKSIGDKILEDYLIDKWKTDETRIKLKPVKNDNQAYRNLYESEDDFIGSSDITINYRYFYEQIINRGLSIDDLFDAIYRLQIISITLNNDDNPQLIFESLNSTGVALSEGDKIRNFMLMDLPTELQNQYYEKYWNKVEVCTNYGVSAFVRDYLSVKQQSIPSQSKVYSCFKDFVEERALETEELLIELLAYAKRYQILLEGKTGDVALDACIYRLNRLETTVTRPFFLEVLHLYDNEVISLSEVGEILQIAENYLFRRMICELPTNALNKIFLMLHKDVVRLEGNEENYVSKLKYVLQIKKENARFPEDPEFLNGLVQKQIYKMNSKNKVYILERLENYGTKEVKNIYDHVDRGDYSIEHIMPQKLTPAWQADLGENYQAIHDEWLHRIGNLTFTAYNSKYSQKPFTEKRDMPNGFRESGLRMNTYISQQTKWTLEEIEERSALIKQRASKIWPYPLTGYAPTKEQMDSYTLEDENDYTGREVVRFSYKNYEQNVSSWAEMFETVVELLHNEDRSVLEKLANTCDDSVELSSWLCNREDAFHSARKIDERVFLNKGSSTWRKISFLKRLFKLYDVAENDLVFYLKSVSEH